MLGLDFLTMLAVSPGPPVSYKSLSRFKALSSENMHAEKLECIFFELTLIVSVYYFSPISLILKLATFLPDMQCLLTYTVPTLGMQSLWMNSITWRRA